MNWNRFLAPDDFQNPDKMAWMIGGRMETPLGSFGLWHAGALRYTFQAFGGGTGEGATVLMYSYTYYPETRFPRGDSMQAIPNRKNYFGLYLGENSAGFRLDWENQYSLPIEGSDDLAVNASLEFTLTGSQSPANPWGEYTTWFQHEQQGTRYLDDELLEKGIILTASGLWGGPPQAWGKLVGSVDIRAGVCLNALRLEAPREVGIDSASQDSQVNQAWIWYPSQEHEAVAEISLGLRYYFPKAK